MSEDKSLPADSANTGNGPFADDKPFVPSGDPNPLPAGEVFIADPDKWYYLKANYVDKNGNSVTGYANSVSQNAGTSFWDYVVFQPYDPYKATLRFKLVPPDEHGWSMWMIHDDDYNSGYRLSCKATGWLYRASWYDVKFAIVDNKMVCSYWGGNVGQKFKGGVVPDGQYLGMDCPAFTCELVPAPS